MLIYRSQVVMARQYRGMTRKTLAVKLGIKPYQIREIEKDQPKDWMNIGQPPSVVLKDGRYRVYPPKVNVDDRIMHQLVFVLRFPRSFFQIYIEPIFREKKIFFCKHPQWCVWCGKDGDKLCDYPVEDGTCDAPLCASCAVSKGRNKDWCPDHKEQKQPKRERK